MKSVVIVDDEIHIQNLLKYLIHWEELGLVLKGCFDSAADVLDFVRQEAVDIVVTDIMMPEMSGLELIERLKEEKKDLRFVIVTGFQDFEFARSAIKLGVSDYLLKPINENEVNMTLKKLTQEQGEDGDEIRQRRAMRQKFQVVLQGKVRNADLTRIKKEFAMSFQPGASYCVALLGICNRTGEEGDELYVKEALKLLENGIKEYCTEEENYMLSASRYAIVLQMRLGKEELVFRSLDQKYREFLQKYGQSTSLHFYLSVGQKVRSLNDLKNSLDGAEFFLNGRLIYKTSHVYIADILPQAETLLLENVRIPPEQVKQFKNAVDAVDERGVRAVIRQLFEACKGSEEEKLTQYCYIPFQLTKHLASVFQQRNVHYREIDALSEELKGILENCDTVPMVRGATERFCVEKMMQFLGGKKKHVQVYVQCAKEYIEEHYTEEVTLNILAEQTHVNPAYLSNIFKETMGVNYSVYLTEVRMEKAKELLEDLDLNIQQIANSVGYASARYFSKIFERETGMKPSEYRRMHLRGLKDRH